MLIHKIFTKLNNRNARLFPKFSTLTWAIIIAFFILTHTFVTRSLKAKEDEGGAKVVDEAETNIISEYAQVIEEGNPNLENWNNANMNNTILKMLDTLVGTKNIADGIKNPDQGFVPGGAIGITTNLIATLYTPPASGIQYLAQIKDNFLGKPAYAQGVGFLGLQPLLPLWRGFRNIVYVLSSLIFVIMGLLIMFRIKTSPQTIITIQSAIPKIITTLILVTFSYAIAGLLIDLMNILQTISLTTLFATNGTSLTDNLFTGKGDFHTFDKLSSAGFWETFLLLNRALPLAMIGLLSVLVGGGIGALVGGLTGALASLGIAGPIAALVGGGIGTIIVLIIIEIIILIKLLQFVFGLAKVYLNVILKIIFSPFEIGFGAIPGVKIGFGSWITNLAANLSVFPLSFLFIVILNILTSELKGDMWAPGMISGVAGTARAIIGFAGILLIAKLPELIPQVIYQIKPSPFDTAIGESVKPPKWLGPVTAGAAGSALISSSRGGRIARFINKKIDPNSTANAVVKGTVESVGKALGGR